MTPYRLCIPIIAGEQAAARQALARIRPLGYLAELRLDYLADPDVAALLAPPRGPVIVTNRLPSEGGRWQGPERQRQILLEQALAAGADYVDIEFAADPSWRQEMLAARGQSRIILSWHDCTGTASPACLADTMLAMVAAGADIIKIVALALSPAAALAPLALIPAARERGQEIIAFAMGPAGKYSRLVAPLLGSYLTFAVLEAGQESAPGQLTVQECLAVWHILGDCQV
ncbi:MAG: type I 3-dehydroquinate dehydratase [Desulfobacca sp.]|uniref:type I 3-dehydroquinate dehydratase n=1 Tax=Desulfobacca sp. TaxID=2067990 RepID=UPI00404B995A